MNDNTKTIQKHKEMIGVDSFDLEGNKSYFMMDDNPWIKFKVPLSIIDELDEIESPPNCYENNLILLLMDITKDFLKRHGKELGNFKGFVYYDEDDYRMCTVRFGTAAVLSRGV